MMLTQAMRRDLDMFVEATDYQQMFAGVAQRAPKLAPLIQRDIAGAKVILKTSERIIWYLRWYKLKLIDDLVASDKLDQETAEREMAVYNSKAGGQTYDWNDARKTVKLLRDFEHFLGLPVEAIQKLQFGYRSGEELESILLNLESKWKSQKSDQLIAMDDDAEIALEYKDGYAWVDLKKPSCSKEAAAMGHCGNSGSRSRSETILSLRKIYHTSDGMMGEPHLTFILDSDGYLGEMKGRGNDRPSGKYHPYIIDLLKSDLVRGIKGGGYLPENNFRMSDLPEKVRKELETKKPELKGFYETYSEQGMTPEVEALLASRLRAKNIGPPDMTYNAEKKTFVIETWRDLDAFLSDIDDTTVSKLLDTYTEIKDNLDTKIKVDEADYVELLRNLPTYYQKKMGITHPDPRVLARFVETLRSRHDVLYDQMYQAFHHAEFGATDDGEKLKDRIEQYIERNWSFQAMSVWVEVGEDFESEVKLLIPEQELVNYADTADEEDSEYDTYVIQQEGWSHVDWDGGFEDRRGSNGEEKLTNSRGDDLLLLQIEKSKKAHYLADMHDIVRSFIRLAFENSSTTSDENQYQLIERVTTSPQHRH